MLWNKGEKGGSAALKRHSLPLPLSGGLSCKTICNDYKEHYKSAKL